MKNRALFLNIFKTIIRKHFHMIIFLLFLYFIYKSCFDYSDYLVEQARAQEIRHLKRKFVMKGSMSGLLNSQLPVLQNLLKFQNKTFQNDIAIVIIVTKHTLIEDYSIAIQTVKCYSEIHNYRFILLTDNIFGCPHEDKFFRRHCVTAKILPLFKAILFIDADIGVVNPKKKIEEFFFDGADLIFYNRFFNFEIAACSYIAMNTKYAIELLNDFANYEFKLPNSFHGTDNGAIHMFLAEKLLPYAQTEVGICREAYKKLKNYDDLSTYTACIRSLLGMQRNIGKVRILSKGAGWARDDWLTSGKWNPDSDFMLHGWKMKQLKTLPKQPISDFPMYNNQWYNPLSGPIHLDKCNPSNSTWSYETALIATKKDILSSLRSTKRDIARSQLQSISRMPMLLSL